jgi:hypothetical protein
MKIHNETHQILFAKGERGEMEYNGRMNLFQVHCTNVKLSQ